MTQTLKLSNIPLLNLLSEFFTWDKQIREQGFKQQFVVGYAKPINTRLLIWGGDPADLLTLILQRVVLGLESYVVGTAWLELGKAGKLTPELSVIVRNPFKIPSGKGQGTAFCYYNALPALIDPKHALEKADDSLWREVKEFYSTVRNKILHGSQIASSDPDVLYTPFDMVRKTYDWVNTWHALEVRDDRPLKMKIILKRPRESH